jgi:thiol-disulfide isomerase/thioredoxin
MSESRSSYFSDDESAAAPAPPSGRWMVWPWIVLVVAVGLVVIYKLQRPPPERTDAGANHAAVGTQIESLSLEPLTGGGSPVTASDLQGRVTLINFWGPWCPPCRVEFPHLMEIEQHFRKNERFQFLSVSCSGGSGSDEEMGPMTAEFLKELGATFPTYRDPHQQSAKHLVQAARLDGFVFPTSVVVDESGIIRGLWQGYAPGDERQIQRVIESTLLAGK